MRPVWLLAGLASASISPAAAQQLVWDGSLGASSTAWRGAAAGIWQVAIGSRLQLGAGARLTRFGGDAKSYRSHDARPPGLPASLQLTPNVWALNLTVAGQVRLLGSLAAGANLDLAGVAAGPSRSSANTTLAPARGSLFLYGDRDLGSLNSEFYLTARVARRLALRGGLSHYVTGYRVTEGSLRPRYLRFDTVPFVALRWVLVP